jgi:hypothetical protein
MLEVTTDLYMLLRIKKQVEAYLYFPYIFIVLCLIRHTDSLCGLVMRVPGYRSRGPGSIPGATRFSEK